MLHHVALFGANGQIGSAILRALEQHDPPFAIRAFVPPDTPDPSSSPKVQVKQLDLAHTSRQELASALEGIDAVVSALNGPVLQVQPLIQDAAADAGVKRFVPSEFGFHQTYRKPSSDWGYIHPVSDWLNTPRSP